MSYPKETFPKKSSLNSSLKALQEELVESKESYTQQFDKLEQIIKEVDQYNKEKKNERSPASITFKKSKF